MPTFAPGLTKNRPQNAHILMYAPLFRSIFRQTWGKIGHSAYVNSCDEWI